MPAGDQRPADPVGHVARPFGVAVTERVFRRDREHFAASDVKNPIGEHWLGLEGVDATNAQLTGYGIHGTIDVDSIGQDRSLGCVRLLSDDVGVVWESLGDGASVEIR